MQSSLYLIPLFPLIGFLINGLFIGRFNRKMIAAIACGAVGLSLIWGVKLFYDLLTLPANARAIEEILFVWISSGQFNVNIGFLLDPLSSVMVLIVSGVGFIIHLYSIGYMRDDPGYGRYFAYLNLFIFSMLTLVMANNYLLMFVGWEGVGLCSYLLIGFWFEKKSAADAGKKAFIVNRIGDFGFLIGLFIIFWQTNSLDFGTVFDKVPAVFIAGGGVITAATLLLFMGAVGKSAQIPLYIWLPDAMEGPTPVSALIHAATMVTAGVYMIARSHILYVMAPVTMAIVAIIGIGTALFAATIAMAQNDIKRVLAYSTISQLGYMFTACGVAAFSAGIFHLMTHAFFKALLFLGAGSIIHALSGQQDLRYMGGLRHRLPTTYFTFLIATLAISGIPGLSGFFSKDEILWKSFSSTYGSPWIWMIGILTAALTAFYMFRLLYLIFFGAERMDTVTKEHLHESPRIMTVPLVVLATLAIIGGYIGFPRVLGGGNWFEKFLEPATKEMPVDSIARSAFMAGIDKSTVELILMIGSIAAVLGAIYLAYYFYIKNAAAAGQLRNWLRPLHKLIYGKYYIDELYDAAIVRPLLGLSLFLWKIVDVIFIDGLINGVAVFIGQLSKGLRALQSGRLRTYATIFLAGVAVIIGYYLFQ